MHLVHNKLYSTANSGIGGPFHKAHDDQAHHQAAPKIPHFRSTTTQQETFSRPYRRVQVLFFSQDIGAVKPDFSQNPDMRFFFYFFFYFCYIITFLTLRDLEDTEIIAASSTETCYAYYCTLFHIFMETDLASLFR